MFLNKERIGGLIFLVLSLAYGYSATLIPFYPGDEFEPITSRTVPNVLAILGIVLSLLMLFLSFKQEQQAEASFAETHAYHWKVAIGLLILMVAYGAILEWLGFAISTILFLIAGYRLLGEKRLKILLLASIPFVLALWLLLTQALSIYLAPGQIFTQLGLGG